MLDIQRRLTNPFFALLSLPATAMGFALSIQIAALSWILSTQYGLDIHEIGIVWAAGPLAGIFGQVIIGVISDRVWFWGGRRRPFILIGGVLAALMLIALPNIHHISDALGVGGILGVAITVALTLDLAINISFNPTRSIIADVTPDGNPRTRGYAWMQTISGFFGVAAYAVGATLGNYILIYAGAVIVLLFSVLPPLFITEERVQEEAPEESDQDAAAGSTRWGQLLRISIFVMLLPHSQTVIAQDDPLTFVLKDTSILEGQLLRVHDSSIFIDTAGIDWEDMSFDSTADHSRIGTDELLVVYVPADYRIFDGMWKGLAIGLGAGIALGALADLTTDDDAGSHGSHPPDTYIGLTTALLAPPGLLIGTIVGFATTRETKTIMMDTEGALEELSSYALFKSDEGTQQ